MHRLARCLQMYFFVRLGLFVHTARLRLSGDGAHYVWRRWGRSLFSLRHRKVWLTEVSAQARFSFFLHGRGGELWPQPLWLSGKRTPVIGASTGVAVYPAGGRRRHKLTQLYSYFQPFFKDPSALHALFSVCLFCQSNMLKQSHKQKQPRRKGFDFC